MVAIGVILTVGGEPTASVVRPTGMSRFRNLFAARRSVRADIATGTPFDNPWLLAHAYVEPSTVGNLCEHITYVTTDGLGVGRCNRPLMEHRMAEAAIGDQEVMERALDCEIQRRKDAETSMKIAWSVSADAESDLGGWVSRAVRSEAQVAAVRALFEGRTGLADFIHADDVIGAMDSVPPAAPVGGE